MKWTKDKSRLAVEGSFSIYCLSDGGRCGIRYFGITKQNPESRFYSHIRDAKIGANNYKTRWISNAITNGKTIAISVIKTGLSEDDAKKIEIAMIRFFKKPFRLTNTDLGGSTGAKSHKFKSELSIRLYDKDRNPLLRYLLKRHGNRVVSKNGFESMRQISREIEFAISNCSLNSKNKSTVCFVNTTLMNGDSRQTVFKVNSQHRNCGKIRTFDGQSVRQFCRGLEHLLTKSS